MTTYKDLWYQSHDGLRLYARDYPLASSSSANPETIILCIPGLTRNSADFSELCEHLSSQYRAIAVDLRGRGHSQYDPEPGNYHPGTYTADILTLINTLELQSVVLIGTSLGGIVSQFVAQLAVGKIKAVVLNDIGPDIEIAGLDRIKDYVTPTDSDQPLRSWQEATARTRNHHGEYFPDMSDDEWQQFAEGLYSENTDGTLIPNYDPNIAQPLLNTPQDQPVFDMWPTFAALAALPTLVIRGELSDILTTECVSKMQQTKPDLEFVEIPRVGHAPLLNEPQARLAIDQFLRSSQ